MFRLWANGLRQNTHDDGAQGREGAVCAGSAASVQHAAGAGSGVAGAHHTVFSLWVRKTAVTRLQVGLSFFEIYADELYDLLNARTKVQCCCVPQLDANDTSDNLSVQLHAREDAKKRVIVQVSVHTLSVPAPCVTRHCVSGAD
jgi:hypothetical protein